MKKKSDNLIRFLSHLFLFSSLIFLFSYCSSFQRMDDAIRIKQDSAYKYIQNPFTNELRNGSTLRGTVLKVMVANVPDTCPITPTTKFTSRTSVVFLDSLTKDEDNLEYIPIEDVFLVGQNANLPMNEYNNINLFENFNDPAKMRKIREVPVDSTRLPVCSPCRCQKFDLSARLPWFDFSCLDRKYLWFFLEARVAYAIYTDVGSILEKQGRGEFFGEIATGLRFGGLKEWGLGLAFSYPIKTYNIFNNTDVSHPVVLLHGRYQSPKEKFLGFCMKPFFYGQLGTAISDVTLDLHKLNFNEECRNRISAYLPYIDISLPITYGIGVGLDIPVAPIMDISIDIGYRSFAFGEEKSIASLILPTSRRINMLVLRAGVTF